MSLIMQTSFLNAGCLTMVESVQEKLISDLHKELSVIKGEINWEKANLTSINMTIVPTAYVSKSCVFKYMCQIKGIALLNYYVPIFLLSLLQIYHHSIKAVQPHDSWKWVVCEIDR